MSKKPTDPAVEQQPVEAAALDSEMQTLLDVSEAAEALDNGSAEADAAQAAADKAQAAVHNLAERNAAFLAGWLQIGVEGAAVKIHSDIKDKIWTTETQNRSAYAVGDALAAFDVDVEQMLGGASSPWMKVAMAALIVIPPTLATTELTKAVYLHRKAMMDAARTGKAAAPQGAQPSAAPPVGSEENPAQHADHVVTS